MSNLEVERYSRGSTARLFLEILASGIGQTNESPTVAIQRQSDGQWLDIATSAFVPTIQEAALTELDQATLPGLYYFDFDHTVDLTASEGFVVRFKNLGANALIDHSHVLFGQLTDSVNPEMCSITGTLFTATGLRAANSLVRATVVPVKTDDLGRGYQNSDIISTYSDVQGEFTLSLVRGLNILLDIVDIGYSRKVCVPDSATALFTTL